MKVAASLLATCGALLVCPPAVGPQTINRERPAFEVASVRPNTAGGQVLPTIRATPGGRFMASWARLRDLIRYAYALQDYEEVKGDNPLLDERFDVDAVGTLPSLDIEPSPRSALGAINVMLQGLLEERFNLRVRWEEEQRSVYLLEMVDNDKRLGSGLRPSACTRGRAARNAQGVAGAEGADDAAAANLHCGRNWTTGNVLDAHGLTMADFARDLSGVLDRPVLDRTGLEGLFDIELEYDALATPQAQATARRVGASIPIGGNSGYPSLFVALKESLGLKLESGRAFIPVLIVLDVAPLIDN